MEETEGNCIERGSVTGRPTTTSGRTYGRNGESVIRGWSAIESRYWFRQGLVKSNLDSAIINFGMFFSAGIPWLNFRRQRKMEEGGVWQDIPITMSQHHSLEDETKWGPDLDRRCLRSSRASPIVDRVYIDRWTILSTRTVHAIPNTTMSLNTGTLYVNNSIVDTPPGSTWTSLDDNVSHILISVAPERQR